MPSEPEQPRSIQAVVWIRRPGVPSVISSAKDVDEEQNSPSCPSQITTKHLISIPTLSLPHFAPLLCINTPVCCYGGRKGEKGGSAERREGSEESLKGEREDKEGRKEIGKEEETQSKRCEQQRKQSDRRHQAKKEGQGGTEGRWKRGVWKMIGRKEQLRQ